MSKAQLMVDVVTLCLQLRKNFRDRFHEDIFAFTIGPNEWAELEKIIRRNPDVDQSRPIDEIQIDGFRCILKCGPGVDLLVRPAMVEALQKMHQEIADEQKERAVILAPGTETIQ